MTLKFKLGLHLKSGASPVPSASKELDNERICLGRSNSIPYTSGTGGSPFPRWLLLRKRARRSSTRDSQLGRSPITPAPLSQVRSEQRRASDTLPYISRSVVIHPSDFTDPFSAAPFTEPPRKNNFLGKRTHLLDVDIPPKAKRGHSASEQGSPAQSTRRRLESLDAIFTKEPPSPTEFMRLRRGLSMNLYGNRRGPGNGPSGAEGDLRNANSNVVMTSNSTPVDVTNRSKSDTAISPLTPPPYTIRKVQKKRGGPDSGGRNVVRSVSKGVSSRTSKKDLLRIAQACQQMARRVKKENPTTCTEAHFHKVMFKIASSIYLIVCAFCAALYWREFFANCIMKPFDRLVPLLCIVLGVGLMVIGLLIRGFVRICFGLFTSFCEADLRRVFHRGECVDAEGRRLDQAGMIVGGLLS